MPRPLAQELQSHDRLPDSRNTRNQREAPDEVSTVEKLIETADPGGHPRRDICRTSLHPRSFMYRLSPAVHLEAAPVHDAKRMSAEQILLTARLDHLDRSHDGSPYGLETESDDGVRDEIFRHRSDGGSINGRVERKHGSDALPVERLDEDMEDLARIAVAVARHPGEAVNENAPRPDRCRFTQQQAIRLLHLLLKHSSRRGDDLEAALPLQFSEIPAKLRRVPHQLLGGDLERDDDSRLVELARTAIDEFDPERRLTGAGRPGDDNHVSAGDAPEQDVVEPVNPCLHQIVWLRHGPLSPFLKLPVFPWRLARHHPALRGDFGWIVSNITALWWMRRG